MAGTRARPMRKLGLRLKPGVYLSPRAPAHACVRGFAAHRVVDRVVDVRLGSEVEDDLDVLANLVNLSRGTNSAAFIDAPYGSRSASNLDRMRDVKRSSSLSSIATCTRSQRKEPNSTHGRDEASGAQALVRGCAGVRRPSALECVRPRPLAIRAHALACVHLRA
eukprot:5210454-Pleurochrysis_carterae.AAC.2